MHCGIKIKASYQDGRFPKLLLILPTDLTEKKPNKKQPPKLKITIRTTVTERSTCTGRRINVQGPESYGKHEKIN